MKLAATLMEWSEPKLWRIETGQIAIRALDVEAMCKRYGAKPGLTEALVALAGHNRAPGWMVRQRPGHPRRLLHLRGPGRHRLPPHCLRAPLSTRPFCAPRAYAHALATEQRQHQY